MNPEQPVQPQPEPQPVQPIPPSLTPVTPQPVQPLAPQPPQPQPLPPTPVIQSPIPPTTPPPIEPPTNSKKPIIFAAIGLLLAIALGVGLYTFLNKDNNPTPSPDETELSSVKDLTENPKVFENNCISFELDASYADGMEMSSKRCELTARSTDRPTVDMTEYFSTEGADAGEKLAKAGVTSDDKVVGPTAATVNGVPVKRLVVTKPDGFTRYTTIYPLSRTNEFGRAGILITVSSVDTPISAEESKGLSAKTIKQFNDEAAASEAYVKKFIIKLDSSIKQK